MIVYTIALIGEGIHQNMHTVTIRSNEKWILLDNYHLKLDFFLGSFFLLDKSIHSKDDSKNVCEFNLHHYSR